MLLVWSELDYLGFVGLHEMCAVIQEDVCGAGMGHNQQDLLRHLDHVLSQFDLGVEYLRLREPNLSEDDVGQMKYEYGELREVLLQVDADVEARSIISSLNQLSFPNH